MFGRGSPKFNMMQKMQSPRSGGIQKKGASPKVARKDRLRASWNPGLEKALVELLQDHNNDCYRGQNGWSSEAWNRIVRLFHDKFTHVSFSKLQIQEKEKELKRDYKMLKEARKQSGASWDDRLCMIQAEPPIWANIIMSFPKARKFQSKPFPLFDALGELYDGHTTEGSMNFTSLEPTPSDPSVTQNDEDDTLGVDDYNPPHVSLHDDDDEVSIVKPPNQRGAGITLDRPTTARTTKEPVALDGGRKVRKRQKQAPMPDMMEKYLELRTKQVEGEVAEKSRVVSEADDFSIKKCISLVNTMEELSGEEKAEAFDIFKDAQNREIFMAAEPIARLIWLRKKM